MTICVWMSKCVPFLGRTFDKVFCCLLLLDSCMIRCISYGDAVRYFDTLWNILFSVSIFYLWCTCFPVHSVLIFKRAKKGHMFFVMQIRKMPPEIPVFLGAKCGLVISQVSGSIRFKYIYKKNKEKPCHWLGESKSRLTCLWYVFVTIVLKVS